MSPTRLTAERVYDGLAAFIRASARPDQCSDAGARRRDGCCMNSTVLTDIQDGVATVTLNRPEVLNALNPAMGHALREVLEKLEHDDAVRCVVVRGAGEHFMAGGDVTFFRDSLPALADREGEAFADIFADVHGAIRILRRMSKPVVASVHGAAAGFGVSLVAACDLAMAAEDTVFTLAYCHIGASPDGGSTYFLPRIIGLKRTLELVFLGERCDAQRALSMGLVNRVVPASELEEATQALAAQLAAGPARAYAHAKALVNTSLASTLDEQLDAEQASFISCAATADFAEGVRAFCEKRKPRFG